MSKLARLALANLILVLCASVDAQTDWKSLHALSEQEAVEHLPLHQVGKLRLAGDRQHQSLPQDVAYLAARRVVGW